MLNSLVSGVGGSFATPAVWAAGFTVNQLTDTGDGVCDGTCTLRDAILAANASGGADTITFGLNGTIALTGMLPVISEALTIDGSGHTIAVDGANAFRVLTATAPVTLTALTIQHGHETGFFTGQGGGAFFGNAAVLNGVSFSNNTANFGGGAYFANDAVLNSASFNHNMAAEGGGAEFASDATLNGVSFNNNTATGGGGGGGAYIRGIAIVTGSSFISNTAASYTGGGAYFAGPATVTASSFVSNTADTTGGGTSFYSTTVVINSTFINNRSGGFAGGAEFHRLGTTVIGSSFLSNTSQVGGGATFAGPVTVSGSTFSHNNAFGGGGAYFSITDATLTGNLFVENAAHEGAGLELDEAATVRLDNNIIAANGPLSPATSINEVYVGFFNDSLTGRHNTFAAATPGSPNVALAGAGPYSQATLTNTIFSDYAVAVFADDFAVRLDGVLWSGVTTPTQGLTVTVSHAYTGSAAFVNAALRDYHLSAASAARDIGVVTSLLVDFDGQTRPNGLLPDMGADEYLDLPYKEALPLVIR
jgi:CSLREA domain-containing protein